MVKRMGAEKEKVRRQGEKWKATKGGTEIKTIPRWHQIYKIKQIKLTK